jgi:UDPglucose--hexose-1-phosphate uridylyltransferase
MPELRHDPIQRRWVIIAKERGARPLQFQGELRFPRNPACPFCEGMEGATPREILAQGPPGRVPDGPGWELRVVPNKFPALQIEGEPDRRGVGLYDAMNGIGAHEVLIETPRHMLHMAEMDRGRMERIFFAYQARLTDLKKDPRFKYVIIFKNYGADAGATIAHPHTQIIATPVTPRTVANELESAREHFRLKERCLFCDILAQEMDGGTRLVALTEHFVALCPYASRFPYEVMVLPRRHHHDFGLEGPEKVADLSRIMHVVLKRLRSALGDPPFNFVFHTAPNTTHHMRRSHYWDTIEHDWHWHVEILPRMAQPAGFEWGTGFYINTVAPELAADQLRKVQVEA